MDLQRLLEVLSPENVALLVVFVVPGYVALEVYSSVVAAERRNFGEELLRVVAVSLLNFVLFFVVFPLGLQEVPQSLGDVGILGGARLLLALVVTPALLALSTYYLRTRRFISGFVVQPDPTAWDYYFGTQREILVRFYFREEAGGGIVGGYYGDKSRASPYPGVQQVYLEEVWNTDANTGEFLQPKEQTGGAIISREDCTLVEFIEFSEHERRIRQGVEGRSSDDGA